MYFKNQCVFLAEYLKEFFFVLFTTLDGWDSKRTSFRFTQFTHDQCVVHYELGGNDKTFVNYF